MQIYDHSEVQQSAYIDWIPKEKIEEMLQIAINSFTDDLPMIPSDFRKILTIMFKIEGLEVQDNG